MPKRPAKTVGVFLSAFTGVYFYDFWGGIREAAKKHGLNLISFRATPRPQMDPLQVGLSQILHLGKTSRFHGLILNTDRICANWGTERIERLCRDLSPLPIVNTNTEMGGYPTVMADNRGGMCSVVGHLIEEHGCKNIAYFKGDPYTASTNQRYDGYVDALRQHDLPLEPELVKVDLYNSDAAKFALDSLAARGMDKIDAVVADSDHMASYVLEHLRPLGVRVPQDLPVTGFGNGLGSETMTSPFTTVRASTRRIGEHALETLYALMQGKNVEPLVVLSSNLILRDSCGCKPSDMLDQASDEILREKELKGASADAFCRMVTRKIGQALGPGWPQTNRERTQKLLKAYTQWVENGNAKAFEANVRWFADRTGQRTEDLRLVEGVFTVLETVSLERFGGSKGMAKAMEPWKKARTTLGNASVKGGVRYERLSKTRLVASEIGTHMHELQSIADLEKRMGRLFPKVDVEKCLFFDCREAVNTPGKARLWAKYVRQNRGKAKAESAGEDPGKSVEVDFAEVMPSSDWPTRSPFSVVVSDQSEPRSVYGYMVFVLENEPVILCELLQIGIGNGLTAFAAQETRRMEDEAREYQERLKISNAALERFAYVVSHDLQEPLRKIQTFGDRLEKQFKDKLGEKGVNYLSRMNDAATRMRSLINGLLQLSRVSKSAKPFEQVDLQKIVDRVAADLEVRIEQLNARVEACDLPVVWADKIQIYQLFLNLTGNALKFHKPDVAPHVQICGSRIPPAKRGPLTGVEHALVTVQDNGIGFEQHYADKIFEAFERLHGKGEYEGSGIGLATCRSIVERHQGTIRARSEPGVGTTFEIRLPLKQPEQEA